MFELVDSNNNLPSFEFKTLAAALSAARTARWRAVPWKVYDPRGEVVHTWGSEH